MLMNRIYILLVIVLAGGILLSGCTKEQDEAIRERTRVPGLSEATQAVDRGLDIQIIGSITSDPALKWYADTYGINVEVSHGVVTMWMKVKTEEQHQQILELAQRDSHVKEIVDEVEVDPSIDDPPFDW